MADSEPTMLSQVKTMLGITDSYHDDAIELFIGEVEDYIVKAGVTKENITPGIVYRGVSDLWNQGSGNGTFSLIFRDRVTQLALSEVE